MEQNYNKIEEMEKKVKEKKVELLEKQLLVERFEQENKLIYSEDGYIIIDCNIGSLSNIYSHYDMQKTKTLEPLLHDYMIEETDIVPLYETIQFNMYIFSNTTDEEEERARKALKTHFSFAVARDNYILKRKIKKGKWFLIFGIACLFGSALISSIQTVFPIYELLLILTWFSFWESGGILLIERGHIKNKILNMLRLYNAKVVFVRSKVPPKSIVMGPTGNQMYSRPMPPPPLVQTNKAKQKTISQRPPRPPKKDANIPIRTTKPKLK